MKPFDQILRDWSRPAIANHTAVDFNHWNHLGRRTGQKTFIRNKDIVAGERYLVNRNSRFDRQFDDRLAGNAVQNTRFARWGQQLAPANKKNIVARTLGHFALVIEHQGFNATRLFTFDLRQNVVELIQ